MNITKGNFRFTPVMYLEAALGNVEKMPQDTFDEIVEIQFITIYNTDNTRSR